LLRYLIEQVRIAKIQTTNNQAWSRKAFELFESLLVFKRQFFDIAIDNNLLSISRWVFNRFSFCLPIILLASYVIFLIIFLNEFLFLDHWYISFYSFSFFVLVSRFCIFITDFAFFGNLFGIYYRLHMGEKSISTIQEQPKDFYNNVTKILKVILDLRMIAQIFQLAKKNQKSLALAYLKEAQFFYHNFLFFSIKAYNFNKIFLVLRKKLFLLTMCLMLFVIFVTFVKPENYFNFLTESFKKSYLIINYTAFCLFIIISWCSYNLKLFASFYEELPIWADFLKRFSDFEKVFKQHYWIKKEISLKNYLSRDDDKTTDKKDYLSFKTILFYFVIFICLPTTALFAFFHNFYSKNSYCLTFAFYFYHSYDVIFTNSFVVFRDLKMLHFYNQYLYIIIPVFFLIVLQRFLENVKTNLFIFCKFFTKMFFWFLVYFFAFIFIFLYVPVFYIFYLAVKDFIFYFL